MTWSIIGENTLVHWIGFTLVVLGKSTRIVHNYHENMLETLVRLTMYGVKQGSQCGFEMSSIFMKVFGYWFLCVLVGAWPLDAQSSSRSSWINFCGGCVRSSFFALESLVCLSLFGEK